MPLSTSSLAMTSGRSSLIGVAISLGGNVLISLALNVQKLAHMQLQDEANSDGNDSDRSRRGRDNGGSTHHRMASQGGAAEREVIPEEEHEEQLANERSPLLTSSRPKGRSNGDGHANGTFTSANGRDSESQSGEEADDSDDRSDNGPSAAYLKSKLWWLGMGLMVIGEGGNFLSYGFAPASLVAPLGAVALLSNVLISPLLLKERFRASDLGGIFLSIIGAVTVVFASKADDPSLGPTELWQAIKSRPFEVYSAVALGLVSFLVFLSTTRWADRLVLIDVGVCAIFGGFTVLSTKGLSSLISQGNVLELLKLPITYALAVVLGLTAVAQITFLNRALQRFDSREVIPVQFVLFTLSAIVGSSILYRDFDNVEPHRLINFLFGVLTTFAGVFVLTKQHMRDSEEGDDEEEGVSERDRDELESGEASASDGELQTVEDGAAQIRSHLHTVPAKQLLIVEPAGLSLGRRGRDRPSRNSGVTSGSVPTSSAAAQQGGQASSSLTSTYSFGGLSAKAAGLAPTRLSFMGNLGPSTRGLSAGTHLLLAATPPAPMVTHMTSVGGTTGMGAGGLTTFAVARTPAHLRQRSMSQPSTPTRRRSRANMRGAASGTTQSGAAAQRSHDSQTSRRGLGAGAGGTSTRGAARRGTDEDLERGLRAQRDGEGTDEDVDEDGATRRWSTFDAAGERRQARRERGQQRQSGESEAKEGNASPDEEMPWAGSGADRGGE